MTVTIPYQGAYNGLAFGPGTDVQLSRLDGLRALPGIRSNDLAKPRQHGSYAGLSFYDERIFTVDLEVFAPKSGASFESVIAGIGSAFTISDPALLLPFEFLLPGWVESRRLLCRPTKFAQPIDQWFQFNRSKAPVEFTAPDPLIYSSTLHTQSTGLPSPTAGLTFPVTFNVTFGASTGGSMSVTNAGNFTSPPVITITGPVTNPTISLPASGAFMKFNISLGASDVLVIDMAARTVTLNGTASRYNTVSTGSSWWGIVPGTSSIGVASTDSAAVTATFTVAWRDAWGVM
jgi:hypothetical protein